MPPPTPPFTPPPKPPFVPTSKPPPSPQATEARESEEEAAKSAARHERMLRAKAKEVRRTHLQAHTMVTTPDCDEPSIVSDDLTA